MSDRINLEDWLDSKKEEWVYTNEIKRHKLKEQGYATGTNAGDTPAGPPMGDPNAPGTPPPGGDPNVANPADEMGGPPQQEEEPDFSSDPQHPDMPEEKKHLDFEQWKKEFLTLAIKGDIQEMKDAILTVRDRNLDSYQRKFVEDNLQIIFLREHSNIDKASKEVKKSIKDNLDQNNPGTSVANYMVDVLDTMPLLNNVYIKLGGFYGLKADLHRKFIAALTGSIQVGSGGSVEDLIYNEKDFSIRISTRFNARFGDVYIGNWNLRTDDPERYLKPPELQRLEDGSPEEKDVLRRRVVMESIAETFKTRAFIINVVATDGTTYTVGWDIATALKAAYTDGKLVVRTNRDDGTEAMIDDDGAIISFVEMRIMYVKDTGEMDEDGKPYKKEIDFMVRRGGQLMLTATLQTIKEAASSFPGIVIRETPYQGNPSDLRVLQRCVPSVPDMIMKQC